MNRRGFLLGLLAAPVIIRTPGILMPIKQFTILPKEKLYFKEKLYLSWESIGGREELADVIYDIQPFDTPIFSMADGMRLTFR